MKKLLFGLFLTLMAGGLMSWHWEQTQYSPVSKTDVIECLNMETLQAYQLEASTPAFAAMHITPLTVNPADLLGKMTSFEAAGSRNRLHGTILQGFFQTMCVIEKISNLCLGLNSLRHNP